MIEKPTFDEVIRSMQYFLNFDDVEDAMEVMVKERINEALTIKLNTENRSNQDVINDLLRDDNSDNKNLKMLLSMTGGSLERIKRIVPFLLGREINLSSIRRNEEIRRRVASFLEDPETEQEIPRFIRKNFILPKNWVDLLKDESYMSLAVRDSLISQYSVSIGLKLEDVVRDIVTEQGYNSQKGLCLMVDNKEVDVAIPSIIDPKMLIMVSYALTTSSSQSQRANEQISMYSHIQTHNRSRSRRGKKDCLMVNVIDGGGWISRRPDLRHIVENCDYCFTHATLDNFRKLLVEHLE